jgi:thymidine kinase
MLFYLKELTMFDENVDSVIKSLSKTVVKLQKVAAKKDAELIETATKMAALSDHCDNCRSEAVRAARIADKLNELLA